MDLYRMLCLFLGGNFPMHVLVLEHSFADVTIRSNLCGELSYFEMGKYFIHYLQNCT